MCLTNPNALSSIVTWYLIFTTLVMEKEQEKLEFNSTADTGHFVIMNQEKNYCRSKLLNLS